MNKIRCKDCGVEVERDLPSYMLSALCNSLNISEGIVQNIKEVIVEDKKHCEVRFKCTPEEFRQFIEFVAQVYQEEIKKGVMPHEIQFVSIPMYVDAMLESEENERHKK